MLRFYLFPICLKANFVEKIGKNLPIAAFANIFSQ